VLVAVEVPFSSTFSAAAGATELLRGWKVAQKLALLALSDVGDRGIGSRGHALAVGETVIVCSKAVRETVIVCSNSSKALAPAFQQHVISYARLLLCRGMFIPRDQQQNPGCQEEMK
jgi:hypothetical protein